MKPSKNSGRKLLEKFENTLIFQGLSAGGNKQTMVVK